jgi:hypothetical protein
MNKDHGLPAVLAGGAIRRMAAVTEALMGKRYSAAFVMLLVVGTATPSYAQDDDKRTWRLKLADGQAMLDYGTNNAEDTPIALSCRAGGGTVTAFIGETGKGVKPGRTLTATLAAGPVTSKLRGRTLPNEEAGVPSFEGKLPISDPLFAALSKGRFLVMTVGPSRQQVPLAEIGDKGDRFIRSCRKNQVRLDDMATG